MSAEGPNIAAAHVPDLSLPFDWECLLTQCDAVVHLAGIAHTYADDDLYDRINHRATERLAVTAVRCGVHLVFISSIAAQSGSFSDDEVTENDPPKPINAYGRSKLAAEQAIRAAGGAFTIPRPVVTYGEGEKDNLATIRKIARLPFPLPFGGFTARRSVLSVQTLNSAITTVLADPRARGETFIVSDPAPVTVADLSARYRTGFGRHPWLFPLPESWFEARSGIGSVVHWWRGRRSCLRSAGSRLDEPTEPARNLTALSQSARSPSSTRPASSCSCSWVCMSGYPAYR